MKALIASTLVFNVWLMSFVAGEEKSQTEARVFAFLYSEAIDGMARAAMSRSDPEIASVYYKRVVKLAFIFWLNSCSQWKIHHTPFEEVEREIRLYLAKCEPKYLSDPLELEHCYKNGNLTQKGTELLIVHFDFIPFDKNAITVEENYRNSITMFIEHFQKE